MLSRHHARTKVLQLLYAYKLSENHDLRICEKELQHSIEKLFDLFYFQISLIFRIREIAATQIEDSKLKLVPSKEDLNPNLRFVNNSFLNSLEQNPSLQNILKNRGTNWYNDSDIPKKILKIFKSSSIYKTYMMEEQQSFKSDRAVVLKLLKKFIYTHRPLFEFYEENSIFWTNDFDYVTFIILKVFQELDEKTIKTNVFTDSNDEGILEIIDFSKNLLRKTVLKEKELINVISEFIENWEIDRIALMDNYIMQLALCELFEFPSIPVKVTLNEYIEIAKDFSTDKSSNFINGVLDKVVLDSKQSKKINKTGRGLVSK
ncbi:MAG: transcription antitermination factor NusB [Bacteroidales bacterium]|nr:transcription antitermination factor NusB [Bacteroidales bacterium]